MPAVSPDEAQRQRLYQSVLQQKLNDVERGLPYSLKIPRLWGQWDEGFKLPMRDHAWPFHTTPEVFFQVSGQTDFLLPRETFSLKAGEAAIMPRGVPHWECPPQGPEPFSLMVMMFGDDCFSFHIASLGDKQEISASTYDRFKVRDHERVRYLVDEMVQVHEEVLNPNDAHIRGLFLASLALARQRSKEGAAPSPEEPPLIRQCREIIHNEMARPELSATWLARQLYCSPNYLSSRFHEFTGMRLIHYIHEFRLGQAVSLLKNSDFKISAIASTCGFKSVAYFHRVFLKWKGTTPMAVRNRGQLEVLRAVS